MKLLFVCCAVFLLAACNDNKDEGSKKDKLSDRTISGPDEEVEEEGDKKNSIVGVWRPYEINIGEMSEEERKQMMEQATIEFTAGGSYISHFDNDTETGSYTYDDKAMTLVTRSPESREERFTVKWDDGLLRLTNKEGEMVLKRR